MVYIPDADAPDYSAEVERRRGMLGNILNFVNRTAERLGVELESR